MNRKFQGIIWLVLLFVGLIQLPGCIPEQALENIVVTEDILYISGEKVRMTGRVLESTDPIDDHGFYIANDESFTSPIQVSLGPKENGLGRFVGEYDGLDINTPYYFKSYANIKGNEVVGIAKGFSSLKPRINKYFPHEGFEGTAITIEGSNFTKDTQVLIGGKKVLISSIENESSIIVITPKIDMSSEVAISVIVQDTTMNFKHKFNYYFGKWNLETTFPDAQQIYEAMFFKDGNNFIFGMGNDVQFHRNLNIWNLDLTTYQWSDIEFPGFEGHRSPFFSNGFWGAGATIVRQQGIIELTPYFWKYSLGVVEPKPFLPFRTYKSVGVTLNDSLFVIGGIDDEHIPIRNFYAFDEASSTWTTFGQMPIDITRDYPYFVYNNEAYFLQPNSEIWRFTPSDNSWNHVGDFPVEVRDGGVAVALNNKIYIGLFRDDKRIWEWDINANSWTQKVSFTGGLRDINTAFFSHDNKVFIFRAKYDGGRFEKDPHMELWSLDPEALK